MAYDYTQWPTAADVQADILNKRQVVPVSLTIPDDINLWLSYITQRITHETLRTFIATASGVVRYFDGSGTGEQEVDEMVSFGQVQVIGYMAVPTSLYINAYAVQEENKPQTRIAIFQGSLPALGRIWLDSFPEGRQNIAVTASWGYGATIPADLWMAVLDGAAQLILRNANYFPNGVLESSRIGPWAESYKAMTPKELVAIPRVDDMIAKYKKPTGQRLRQLTPRMI